MDAEQVMHELEMHKRHDGHVHDRQIDELRSELRDLRLESAAHVRDLGDELADLRSALADLRAELRARDKEQT